MYTPVKYVTVQGSELFESSDLTQILSTFIQTHTYLILEKNSALYALDVNRVLLYVTSIDITQPLSSAFTSVLTDAFVALYSQTNIPVKQSNGFYRNRLRVLNPLSYKDYEVDFTSTNTPDIVNDDSKRGYLDDLVITSATEDLTQSLVCVNGVFHRTSYLNGKLYVIDGFRTLRLSGGRKDLTLVDTTDLGGHTVIPLTTDNVTHTIYNGMAHVNVGTSFVGKTVCAVIDGYFYHLDDDILVALDPTHLGIMTNKLPLITQFRHNPRTMYVNDLVSDQAVQGSRRYTDAYANLFIGNTAITASPLETVAFQLSRLTAYHSFLVVFNQDHQYQVNREVVSQETPRFYYDYSTLPLSGMVRYGCGLSPSYLIHQETSVGRQVFINGQDDSLDYESMTYDPSVIPGLIADPKSASETRLGFVDYVRA